MPRQSRAPAPPPAALPPRAWIDVDLGALVRNGRRLAARAGRPLLPMVKADGYGVGAIPAARALETLAPWGYGVASVAEGAELRAAGIARPIVVFTPLLDEELPAARDARLTPTLHRASSIAWWGATKLPWHLAIDTGMSRAGVPWFEIGALVEALRAAPPEGVFTHFHSAELGDGSVERQLARFREALAVLPARPPLVHAENSAAVHRAGDSTFDLVRPGLYLYGAGGGDDGLPPAEAVAALRARVVDLRDVPDGDTVSYLQTYRAVGPRRIATLAAGYGDGYPRAAGNRAWAAVHGRRAPVAGLVTMDMTMLDVTDLPCAVGDVATLLGRADEGAPDVAALAALVDASPYELLTRLRGRLPRRYAGADAPAPAPAGSAAS